MVQHCLPENIRLFISLAKFVVHLQTCTLPSPPITTSESLFQSMHFALSSCRPTFLNFYTLISNFFCCANLKRYHGNQSIYRWCQSRPKLPIPRREIIQSLYSTSCTPYIEIQRSVTDCVFHTLIMLHCDTLKLKNVRK